MFIIPLFIRPKIKETGEKRDQLLSSNDEDKKLVIQEFIDKVIVDHKDNGDLDVEITVRFSAGKLGEYRCQHLF